ncbi:hypothetical protein CCP2SC5_60016 [Azospirillaceae bacterium]
MLHIMEPDFDSNNTLKIKAQNILYKKSGDFSAAAL